MRFLMFDDFVPGMLADDGTVVSLAGLVPMSDETRRSTGLVGPVAEALGEGSEAFAALARAGGGVPLDRVRLRQPVPRPGKVIGALGNYLEGVERDPRPLDTFLKSPDSVIGPGDTVVLPERDHRVFHHEAELGVVIGRTGRGFSPEEALDHVLGYTAFMDVSAREGIGLPESRSFMGKSYDTFGPMGPVIATRDEIPDPNDLAVKYWVDGALRHDYHTSDMEHRVPELLSFVASVMTLNPGDLVICGTNHQGIGPLQDGEVARIEIERIGAFEVSVVDDRHRVWERVVDQQMADRLKKRNHLA